MTVTASAARVVLTVTASVARVVSGILVLVLVLVLVLLLLLLLLLLPELVPAVAVLRRAVPGSAAFRATGRSLV
ncbi:hypothetical protein PV318_05750 [Streptomyces sp. ME02-6991-2B]|nr:hypothetical protein [Streptomyces sp. ME02-6991-2B]